MPYDLYQGDAEDDKARVSYLMQLFHHARLGRVNFEIQWEEAAALMWPEYRNSFSFGHVRSPGVKYTQYQVDTTGSIKAWRFMCVADALVTPFNMLWSRVSTSNKDLLKVRAAREYFDAWTQLLWTERYKPQANFQAQQQTNWQALGVFGNQAMITDELDTAPGGYEPGLRYMACSPGEIYILTNHQNRVDGYIRHFRWTARQAYSRWGDAIPKQLLDAAAKADSYTRFDFLQFVLPRTDYDPNMMFTNRGKRWSSIYVCVIGYQIVEEGGYYDFPLAHGRYMQAPEEDLGRGPAQMVLAELKTKNSEKEAFLKQGVLAGDPMYLLPSDDLFDFKASAGNYIPGGMSSDGKPLVGTLQPGNIQITKELMEDSDKLIDAAFLNDLFPLLFDKDGRQRGGREVIEMANQSAIFLAPTLGRQFGEYIGTMINREMRVLQRLGKAPKMPPVVREARGEFDHIYTSPLGRALNAQGIAGYMRSVEMAASISQSMGGDPSVFDPFDFEVAIPEIAEQQHSPLRWMATADKIAAKQKARQAQAERERQSREKPADAAIIKAQAIAAKAQAGQNIGGALSGTPEGGMPLLPNGQGR